MAAVPGQVFDGELLRFAPSADRESGTLDAIFRVPNPELWLRPGMRAEFSIVTSTREGVMTVPREAVQGDREPVRLRRGLRIEERVCEKRRASSARKTTAYIEITSGLLPGDQVVTRGAYALAFAGKGSVSLEGGDGCRARPSAQRGRLRDDAGTARRCKLRRAATHGQRRGALPR